MMHPAPQSTFVALLRGINVGGRNRLPMEALRGLCAGLGWEDVRSYIQSGNLVFRAGGPPPALEIALERAIQERFGFAVPVIARPGVEWQEYRMGNPFAETAGSAGKLVMLAIAKQPPAPDAAERLRERARPGERIERVGDAIWIHYAAGVRGSKLSPGLLDRAVGSPVTTRNWRTVVSLAELVSPTDLPASP